MKIILSLMILIVSQVSFSQTTQSTTTQTQRSTTPVTTESSKTTQTYNQTTSPSTTATTPSSTTRTTETTQISAPPVMPAPTVQSTTSTQTTVNSPNEVIVDEKEILLLEEKQAREVRRGSSEFNRINKNYSIATQVFGQGPVAGRGIGLSFGQFLDRNRVVLYEWMRNDSADDDLASNEDINNFSVGVHFKKYEKDFYYWRMGSDYRFGSYEVEGTNGGSFNADSLNVTLAVGAQWYFETFTAGIDAAGVSVPIFTNIRNEKTRGSFREAAFEDEKEDLATETTYVLGRLYLGMAF